MLRIDVKNLILFIKYQFLFDVVNTRIVEDHELLLRCSGTVLHQDSRFLHSGPLKRYLSWGAT